TDTSDYTTATGSVMLAVNQATPTLNWPTPAAITYGTALTGTQLDATANVAGSFSYSPATGTALGAGQQPLSVTFTPTDTSDYTTATGSVMLAVNQVTPTLNWPTPAAITYGTALSGTQLDATATIGGSTLAGTFTYTLADGTPVSSGSVLDAGQNQVLNVAFTPTDTTDYATDTAQVEVNVDPAPLTITADDTSKVYGAALPTLTVSYSGFVNGDTAANLATTPTLSTTATVSSHVSGSPYAITAGGAVDTDYTISYVAGALRVTPARLTVEANDASKAQGAPNPTFTDTISGFVNGDKSSVVSGTASLSTTATTTSGVGSYPIIAALGTLNAADYKFIFEDGTLTVTSSTSFVAKDAVYTVGSGSVTISAAGGLLANDTGPSQLTVTAGTVVGAQGGTFVFHADGSFTYTPTTNFPGYDNAPFTVTDTSGDMATRTVTVLSQHASVVWKFYESVLNRVPDPAGLQYWTNYFNSDGDTGQMAVGFFESTELLDRTITDYYQQYLLRSPDAVGLPYWVGMWQATGGSEQIEAGFADSPEFYNSAGGTPQSWLSGLYQRILDRAPDPQGQQFWLNDYQQQAAAGVDPGTIRHEIAMGFFDSPEAFGDDATGWFREYLFRAPTDAEKAQYVNQMEGGSSDRTIEQEITDLPEYASNPATPADGSASPLADYYQKPAQSQAVVSAKDALFSSL
ncbi:MAG TPA: MBG domain-containing protein, partial [Pirellulales bacterium]|nr:MBG domain-containing protein [Pirellulales bacterium]